MPEKTDRQERKPSVSEKAEEMREFFSQHGFYRQQDVSFVLGDSTVSIEIKSAPSAGTGNSNFIEFTQGSI